MHMSTTDTAPRRGRYAQGAARLRRLRYARGLTVPDVAGALGVSVRTVYAWEQGTNVPQAPSYAALRALLQTTDLLWFTEETEEATA